MNSRKMRKMASDVVRVSKKQVFGLVKSKSDQTPEKHSLISKSQPLSHFDINHSSSTVAPKGFVAVYVGPHDRRFMIPTKFLSVPEFKEVMEMTAEEFGYEQQGGLRIPCDEDDFEKLLRVCKLKSKSKSKSGSSFLHMTQNSHAIPISN